MLHSNAKASSATAVQLIWHRPPQVSEGGSQYWRKAGGLLVLEPNIPCSNNNITAMFSLASSPTRLKKLAQMHCLTPSPHQVAVGLKACSVRLVWARNRLQPWHFRPAARCHNLCNLHHQSHAQPCLGWRCDTGHKSQGAARRPNFSCNSPQRARQNPTEAATSTAQT